MVSTVASNVDTERLRARMLSLEQELASTRNALAKAGQIERTASAFVEVVFGRYRAAIPVDTIREVASVPATVAIPDAPAFVAGSFRHRGAGVVLYDLEARLTATQRVVPFEAQIVILNTSRLSAIVIDRVAGFLQSPSLSTQPTEPTLPSGLVCGYLKIGDSPLPILTMEPLVQETVTFLAA